MGIERDCKKIHKKIRKFYEKYKDKRNICFNLQCNKENDSYDICLYVNPKIEELDVMKENIKKTSITQQTGKLMRMVIRSVLMAMSSVSS